MPEQDDDDQVLYDEEIAAAAPTAAPTAEPTAAPTAAAAAPASEPEPSAPVAAPVANGTELSDSPVRAFPLEQLPTAMLEDTQPAAAAAAESVPAGGQAQGADDAADSSNGLQAGKAAAFNDNMYWKSSYVVEVDDI
jgi:hypothetical protein